MSWFRRTKRDPASQLAERYSGRPLLIILENYVLDSIGKLEETKFIEMGSIVSRVYGGGKDWKATVRATLELDEGIDEYLRGMWERNQDIARRAKTSLSPEEFARMVVDENFADLIPR